MLPARGALVAAPVAAPALAEAEFGIGIGTDGTTWFEPKPNWLRFFAASVKDAFVDEWAAANLACVWL